MQQKNYLILISGSTCAGKTTFSKKIEDHLINKVSFNHIEMDMLYKEKYLNLDFDDFENFDSPKTFDWKLIRSLLKNLVNNKPYTLPSYMHSEWKLNKLNPNLKPSKIIFFDGIFSFHDKEIRKISDYRIFVDTDLDICLKRRFERDSKLGRNKKFINEQWSRFILPNFKKFVLPTKKYADIIIDCSGNTLQYEIKVLNTLRNFLGDKN